MPARQCVGSTGIRLDVAEKTYIVNRCLGGASVWLFKQRCSWFRRSPSPVMLLPRCGRIDHIPQASKTTLYPWRTEMARSANGENRHADATPTAKHQEVLRTNCAIPESGANALFGGAGRRPETQRVSNGVQVCRCGSGPVLELAVDMGDGLVQDDVDAGLVVSVCG